MSDEQKLHRLINQARSFKELREDARFELLVNTIGTEIFAEWSNTDDGSKAKELWQDMRALKKLSSRIDTIIAEGTVAAKELNDQHRAEKSDYGSRPITGDDVRELKAARSR